MRHTTTNTQYDVHPALIWAKIKIYNFYPIEEISRPYSDKYTVERGDWIL